MSLQFDNRTQWNANKQTIRRIQKPFTNDTNAFFTTFPRNLSFIEVHCDKKKVFEGGKKAAARLKDNLSVVYCTAWQR